MKRLLTVALGVALCSIAPAAIAAPNHIPTSDNPAIFSDSNDDSVVLMSGKFPAAAFKLNATPLKLPSPTSQEGDAPVGSVACPHLSTALSQL